MRPQPNRRSTRWRPEIGKAWRTHTTGPEGQPVCPLILNGRRAYVPSSPMNRASKHVDPTTDAQNNQSKRGRLKGSLGGSNLDMCHVPWSREHNFAYARGPVEDAPWVTPNRQLLKRRTAQEGVKFADTFANPTAWVGVDQHRTKNQLGSESPGIYGLFGTRRDRPIPTATWLIIDPARRRRE